MRFKTLKSKLLLVGLLTFALAIVEDFTNQPLFGDSFIIGSLISEAEARVGRPMSPGSVAGVARRTSRRHYRRSIRRSTIYITTLPTTCIQETIESTVLWHCGTTYYQRSGTQYVVVYVD